MKKALILGTIVAVTAFLPLNRAYGADSSVKKPTFFQRIVDKISSLLGTDSEAQASSSAGRELGEARTSLLKTLNKYELLIRVSVSGGDIYLRREILLAKIEKAKELVSKSTISSDHQKVILGSIDELQKVLNEDLINSPQDKIKPLILSMFDQLEALVFEMSEDEAAQLLVILQTLQDK